MELIDLSAVVSTPEAIFLYNLLNLTIIPGNPQKVLLPFTDVEVNEHDQKYLTYLNLDKEITQTCKGDMVSY